MYYKNLRYVPTNAGMVGMSGRQEFVVCPECGHDTDINSMSSGNRCGHNPLPDHLGVIRKGQDGVVIPVNNIDAAPLYSLRERLNSEIDFELKGDSE